MVVKTTIKTSTNHRTLLNRINKQSKEKQNRITRLWAAESAVEVKKMILSDIARGQSPVRGEKAFKRYSQSYKDTINGIASYRTIRGKVVRIEPRMKEDNIFSRKKDSPVNLKLTGAMLDSLKTSVGTRSFTHSFTSKIAEYHNKLGAGKSKVIRRMLPRQGEKYNLKISGKITKILRDVIKKVIRRQS